MTGVYKITNPKGHVYIGKSNCIHCRFNSYRGLPIAQSRLAHSLAKYGYEAHRFEVLKECEVWETSKWEIFYYEKYLSELGRPKLLNGCRPQFESPEALIAKHKLKYLLYLHPELCLPQKTSPFWYSQKIRFEAELRSRKIKNEFKILYE